MSQISDDLTITSIQARSMISKGIDLISKRVSAIFSCVWPANRSNG